MKPSLIALLIFLNCASAADTETPGRYSITSVTVTNGDGKAQHLVIKLDTITGRTWTLFHENIEIAPTGKSLLVNTWVEIVGSAEEQIASVKRALNADTTNQSK